MTQGFLFGGNDPSKQCSREAREKVPAEILEEKIEREYYTVTAATADEIALRLGLPVLSVRPRVAELKKRGALYPTGERRKNSNGNSCAVMRHWRKQWTRIKAEARPRRRKVPLTAEGWILFWSSFIFMLGVLLWFARN